MTTNLFSIPEELRQLKQWLVWRYEDIGAKKPTKVPYNPSNPKQMASVIDPATWSDFDTAIKVAESGFSGIGFVFTDNDPYTFIDLDDATTLPDGSPNPNYNACYERQIKIYKEFDSYSEISPSGKGLHIIVRGAVPAGRRRSFIEVYSTQRYATFTGNVYNAKPIAYQQDKLSQLWEQMGAGGAATHIYKGDDRELLTDAEVIDRALKAVNGDKFDKLLKGNWQDLVYTSQSEADMAFIDIIAFYTQNRKQIERIFRSSPLGQRDKAQRNDYVTWMVNKSFDRMLPMIDIEGHANAIELAIAEKKANDQQLELALAGSPNGKASVFDTDNLGSTPSPAAMPHSVGIPIPPGLMGEIAQYIYHVAPRPVPEIALAAAIGLMAGIAGRAYNVSGTGLNQYIMLIANTGIGKEAMALGIDKLMNTIKLQVPTAMGFIGPGEIASGQALVKYLNKNQCFVSILGEFGLRLQSMTNQHANAAELSLKRMLLDLFGKSGHGQVFRPSIFADKDKNIDATQSPSFSILGESTPERFYGALSEEMISEGLLPRFMLIEYLGNRPPLNPNHIHAVPGFTLVESLASLAANCEKVMHSKQVIDVKMTNEAKAMFDSFDKFCDGQINGTNKEVLRQLWNRAHIKALKISALVAVGVNISDPLITPDYVTWAINMVQSDIRTLSNRFEAGEIGSSSSENKQTMEMARVIKDYVTLPWDRVKAYSDNITLYNARVIPYGYLSKRLVAMAAFRNDRQGSTASIKRTIQVLIDSDKLREVGKQELATQYGTTQRAFVISNPKLIE